jgi:glycosyltransferase involved in cell wall biosynthesis
MKIALACPASLPATQFGGILFLCVDIARELAKIGHDVTIYTTDLDFANNAKTFNKKLPRIENQQGFKIKRSHSWFALELFFVNPGMYSQLKNDNPDVIHTVGIRSFQSLVAAIISKRYDIPLVISDQGGLTTHPDLKNANVIKKILYSFQNITIRFIINQAVKIIVANDYEKEIFLKFTPASKIVVIRNGINLETLQTHNSNFKKKYDITNNFILFVGRFNKVKGIDILIRAWSLIKDNPNTKNFKLVIMGVDFGFESEMFKLISELKIENRILVIRKPPREDVIEAYQACEFLVLPSRWELSPLTPLEGFAFKKPVISTRTHGIPYTIQDGKNALLIEPEDHKQLSEAILKFIEDNKMRIEYGLEGYRFVHDVCNSETMAKNTLKVYEEVVI